MTGVMVTRLRRTRYEPCPECAADVTGFLPESHLAENGTFADLLRLVPCGHAVANATVATTVSWAHS